MELEYGIKMTWHQFCEWERWDEFPERQNNPPYTVEPAFRYKDRCYFIDHYTLDKEAGIEDFVLVDTTDDGYVEIAHFDNFLKVVAYPYFDGKSFMARIEEFEFAY